MIKEILGTGHLDSLGMLGHERSWIGNVDDGSEGMALVSGVGSSMYREITKGASRRSTGGVHGHEGDARGNRGYPSRMRTDGQDDGGTGLRSQEDVVRTWGNINVYNETSAMEGRRVYARADDEQGGRYI